MTDLPLPKLTQIPPSVAAVADYEPLARERMSAQAWAYIAGGAADELTLAENQAAFQRIRLRTRVLAGCQRPYVAWVLFLIIGHRIFCAWRLQLGRWMRAILRLWFPKFWMLPVVCKVHRVMIVTKIWCRSAAG